MATNVFRQYKAIKGKYPDAILLFRLGDNYESFERDALNCSQILGIPLIRGEVDSVSFNHTALDTYLPKLVRQGFRVAICDQLEDANDKEEVICNMPDCSNPVSPILTKGLTTQLNLFTNHAGLYRTRH